MGNSISVWARDVSNTGFTVVGKFNNNGYTYEYAGSRFTLSIDGVGNIYDRNLTFAKGQSFEFSAYYNAGVSASARTYTIHAWWDSSGFGYVDNN